MAGGLLRTWLSGSSPRTPSRPSWRALSNSHLRHLRCEAEASAARARAPARRLLDADAFASFMESSLELSPSASSLRGRSFGRGDPRAPQLAGSSEPGLAASRRGHLRVLNAAAARARALCVSRPPTTLRLHGSTASSTAKARRRGTPSPRAGPRGQAISSRTFTGWRKSWTRSKETTPSRS